jgi:hypothetical protein
MLSWVKVLVTVGVEVKTIGWVAVKVIVWVFVGVWVKALTGEDVLVTVDVKVRVEVKPAFGAGVVGRGDRWQLIPARIVKLANKR